MQCIAISQVFPSWCFLDYAPWVSVANRVWSGRWHGRRPVCPGLLLVLLVVSSRWEGPHPDRTGALRLSPSSPAWQRLVRCSAWSIVPWKPWSLILAWWGSDLLCDCEWFGRGRQMLSNVVKCCQMLSINVNPLNTCGCGFGYFQSRRPLCKPLFRGVGLSNNIKRRT